jgi:hypothetical protein
VTWVAIRSSGFLTGGFRTRHDPGASSATLDGSWAFWPDLRRRLATGPGAPFVPPLERDAALGPARSAHVPGPWQGQFEDLRLWAGTAWYERELPVASEWRGRRIRLRFGAIDYFASVWVNDRLAGEHEGGYLPFSLEVTDLIRFEGPNTVTVRVLDVGPGNEDDPFPFSEIPHGKQSWYGPIGGLWQSAWIEGRGRLIVDHVRIDADRDSGEVIARIRLDGSPLPGDEVRWWIFSPDGAVVASGDVDDLGAPTIRTSVPDPIAWDVDMPALYRLEIEVLEAGVPIDRGGDRFGFRALGVSAGRVTLNGRPVYLLGALDQDYWSPGIATAGSDAAIDDEMWRAKELGLNLLRCHIKPPDPRYLDAADRAGVLVWCEPPNWIRLTESAKRRAHETLAGMVDRDWNHPSVAIRSIVNEDWGTDLPSNAEHRVWLRETYRWVKSIDPARLVVDNSACPPNFHVESDLNDFHVYRAVPEQATSWREWTSGWVREPTKTYSPHGDATVRGSEPLVVSEFGIWGLPNPDLLLDDAGRAPWWFDTGQDHSGGIVHPAGIRERFESWALEAVFGSFGAFVRESQEHEFEGLKLQIEDLRLHDAIGGYVITEFADVHWEANGLLDMRRGPKAFHGRFDTVNAPNVVVVRTDRARYCSGDEVVARARLLGAAGPVDGRIEWELVGYDLGGEVEPDGRARFRVPPLRRPTRGMLKVRWIDRAGGRVNENAAPIWLSPVPDPVRNRDVAVSTRWGDVARDVAGGGRAVILVQGDEALPGGAPIRVEPFGSDAEGASPSVYGNGWVLSTGMGWVSPAIGDGLAVGPRVDLTFEGITPNFVLEGYAPDARADVLAGHYLGWLHRVRATIAAFSHGRGAGIVCALPLLQADARDPLATALLDRITALASAPGLAPQTTI